MVTTVLIDKMQFIFEKVAFVPSSEKSDNAQKINFFVLTKKRQMFW